MPERIETGDDVMRATALKGRETDTGTVVYLYRRCDNGELRARVRWHHGSPSCVAVARLVKATAEARAAAEAAAAAGRRERWAQKVRDAERREIAEAERGDAQHAQWQREIADKYRRLLAE